MTKRIVPLIFVILFALPCFAQTYDYYGGLITYVGGTSAPTCTWPHTGGTPSMNFEIPITSITGNGTTATATVGSTAMLGAVGNKMQIYVINVTNAGFDQQPNNTDNGVQATIASSTTLTYANTTNASSSGGDVIVAAWYLQEINSHWYSCDPVGHIFQNYGIAELSIGSIHGTCAIVDVLHRIFSWGFNTLLENVYSGACNGGTHGLYPWNTVETVKMPVLITTNFSYLAVTNVNGGSFTLTNPVKNMIVGRPPLYFTQGDYVYGVIADDYDTNLGAMVAGDISGNDGQWFSIKSSLFNNFTEAALSDDSDYMAGISGATPDFTDPNGAELHIAMMVATEAPVQVAVKNAGGRTNDNILYNNPQVYSKLGLRDFLLNYYLCTGSGTPVATCTGNHTGTGSADPSSGSYVGSTNASNALTSMNTAIGSSYSSWNSTGTCVGTSPIPCAATGAAITLTGSGTGPYTATLTSPEIFSVQVDVSGSPVAGDLGLGNATTSTFYGPNVSASSINYSTGAVSVTFSSTPAAGPTLNYISCGWQCGTGLLDEDDRTAHQAYLGTSFFGNTNGSAGWATVANLFVTQFATQYFSQVKTNIQNVFPWMMFWGPNTYGTYNLPPNKWSLAAAANYLDACIIGGGAAVMTQAEMNYVETNYGNHPYMNAWYGTANNDSNINTAYTGAWADFTTQVTRGAAYYSMVQSQVQSSSTTSGNFPYIGVYFWEYINQSASGGLVTPTDNSFDAAEPTSGTVSCSTPIGTYTCGSEPAPAAGGGTAARPYGNFIGGTNTGVTAANALWTQAPGGGSSHPPAPSRLSVIVANKK